MLFKSLVLRDWYKTLVGGVMERSLTKKSNIGTARSILLRP
jgi:hypothetical protein